MEIKVATFQDRKVALCRTMPGSNKYYIAHQSWSKDGWQVDRTSFRESSYHDANAEFQRYIDEEDYTLEEIAK